MNVVNIYLKPNDITKAFDFYINGVKTNSNYKFASQALGIVTPSAYLTQMHDKLLKHVFTQYKSYCQELQFYSGTQWQYESWAKTRNILPTLPCEVVIRGISDDGKSVIDYEYVADEVIHEAIIESEKLPMPTKEDWVCN